MTKQRRPAHDSHTWPQTNVLSTASTSRAHLPLRTVKAGNAVCERVTGDIGTAEPRAARALEAEAARITAVKATTCRSVAG